MEPTLDADILGRWVGRRRETQDRVDCRQAEFLRATLDPDRTALRPGEALPPGWHWIYCLEAPRIDRLGSDGHAALGDFLPPVALPKRMWAGTRLRFHQPIRLEDRIRKVSTVVAVVRRRGNTGELCFVTVNHRYFAGADLRLEEDHDIVYCEQSAASRTTAPAAETESDESIVVTPSSTFLFRYSALTFNGHRIHYDLDFCRTVENYPGLVVHAPLVATLMLGMAERFCSGRAVRIGEFRQRSVRPLFHDHPLTIHLREGREGCDLWVADHDGLLAATAFVSLG